MWCLLKAFPFLVADKVPVDDPYLQHIIDNRQFNVVVKISDLVSSGVLFCKSYGFRSTEVSKNAKATLALEKVVYNQRLQQNFFVFWVEVQIGHADRYGLYALIPVDRDNPRVGCGKIINDAMMKALESLPDDSETKMWYPQEKSSKPQQNFNIICFNIYRETNIVLKRDSAWAHDELTRLVLS